MSKSILVVVIVSLYRKQAKALEVFPVLTTSTATQLRLNIDGDTVVRSDERGY